MIWGDERYVRVYCRNTPDLVAMGWEARALLWELLRHADRAGRVALGKHGPRGLAALIHMPAEVVERAIAVLVADGCVRASDAELVLPNFIVAQESTKSDALRKRDQRERERDAAIGRVVDVTSRDPESRRRDPESRDVTSGHAESRDVTPCCAVPSVPCSAVQGVQGESSLRDLQPSAPPVAADAAPGADAPPTPTTKTPGGGKSAERTKRASRLPSGWKPSRETLRSFAELGVDARGSLDAFRDHWAASSGRNATKVDWDAAFRNWVREDINRGRASAYVPPPACPPLPHEQPDYGPPATDPTDVAKLRVVLEALDEAVEAQTPKAMRGLETGEAAYR